MPQSEVKALQAEHRNLLERRATDRDIAHFEKQMSDRHSAYWKSETLQAEYRALVAKREGLPDETVSSNDAVLAAFGKDLRPVLGAELAAEWDVQGFDASMQRVQSALRFVVEGMEKDEMASQLFVQSLDQLPAGARTSLLREFGGTGLTFVKPATDGEMAAFKKLPGGAETNANWGSRAKRNVATALERYNRMQERIPVGDRTAYVNWWRSTAPRVQQLLLQFLGSSS